MNNKLLLTFILFLSSIVGFTQTVFINEIHYDNSGGDVNEGIEMAGPAGTNLACYAIYLYNGSNGQTYSPLTVLSGTIDNEGCGYGAVWFPISGIQNGAPDGIVLYNTCTSTVVQFLSYEGTFTATNSVANGLISTDILVKETGTTPIGSSLQLTGTGTNYTSFTWNAPTTSSIGVINSGQNFCTCTPASPPTTNATSLLFNPVQCNNITLTWTNGNGTNRIVVVSTAPITSTPIDQTTYVANSNFGSGSTIAAGEFVVYNGTANTINVTGLSPSTTYYFTIFEYNGITANCTENYLTTGNLTASVITTTCSCPQISGIMVDVCGAGAQEGINEFFVFKNGNSNLPIDSLSATFPNGGTFCNTCTPKTWTTNPTYVAALNTTAGCVGLFVEANPIPANAKVIVFTGALPTFAYNFAVLCSTGPYYAVFANNTATAGRFANYTATCGSIRTLTTSFGAACKDTVAYDRCLLSIHSNGDYVTFTAAGTASYANDSCSSAPILPIKLLRFRGTSFNQSNQLSWQTASEINNDYFTLERSVNAVNFKPIATINGAGNSNALLNYNFVDNLPNIGVNYYRLKQTDFNGDFSFSKIISLKNKAEIKIIVSHKQLSLISKDETSISSLNIYNINGKKVLEKKIVGSKKVSLSNLKKGIYLYKIKAHHKILSTKFLLYE